METTFTATLPIASWLIPAKMTPEQQIESLAEKAVFSLAKGVEALATHDDNAPAWFVNADRYKKEIDKILTHPIETDDDYKSLGELVEDESEDIH